MDDAQGAVTKAHPKNRIKQLQELQGALSVFLKTLLNMCKHIPVI